MSWGRSRRLPRTTSSASPESKSGKSWTPSSASVTTTTWSRSKRRTVSSSFIAGFAVFVEVDEETVNVLALRKLGAN